MGIQDACDGVIQQISINALPQRKNRTRVGKTEVIIGEESEHNCRKGVHLVFCVTWNMDTRQRVLQNSGSEKGSGGTRKGRMRGGEG